MACKTPYHLFTPDDIKNDEEKFWVERPGDLLTHFTVFPIRPKSKAQLFNAITRIIIIIFIILLILRVKKALYFLIISLLIIIFVYYNTKSGSDKECCSKGHDASVEEKNSSKLCDGDVCINANKTSDDAEERIEGYRPIERVSSHETLVPQAGANPATKLDKSESGVESNKRASESTEDMRRRSNPVEQNHSDIQVDNSSPVIRLTTRNRVQSQDDSSSIAHSSVAPTRREPEELISQSIKEGDAGESIKIGKTEREYVTSTVGHDPRSAIPAVSIPAVRSRGLRQSIRPTLDDSSPLPTVASRKELRAIREAALEAKKDNPSLPVDRQKLEKEVNAESTSFSRKNKDAQQKRTLVAPVSAKPKTQFVRKGQGDAFVHVQHDDSSVHLMDAANKEDIETEVYYQTVMEESAQANALNILHS